MLKILIYKKKTTNSTLVIIKKKIVGTVMISNYFIPDSRNANINQRIINAIINYASLLF